MRITRRYRRRGNFIRKGRRTRIQTRRLLQAWAAGIVGALALLLAASFLLFRGGGRPGFEKGDLLVCVNGDGRVEFYWPESTDASALYRVDFTCGTERMTRIAPDSSFGASPVQAGERLDIRVWAVTDGTSLFGEPKEVKSWKSFHARLTLPETPEAPEVTGTLEDGAASLRWEGAGDVYAVFRDYEAFSVLEASTREREAVIPLEGETSPRQFAVRTGWKKWGYVLCGPAAHPAAALAPAPSGGGRDLPSGGALGLTCQETAPRLCVLEWSGVQCRHFEVRRRAGEDWEILARLLPEEHMRYDLGRLGSGSYNRFRVAAVGEDGAELQAEEVSFWASVDPLYATVWPIESMNFWENPSGGERLGSIPGGTALCVLAEEGKWFRVRYGEEYGWIDSRYCMIDLPEYVGDHCSYDITNSYDSLFAVHGSPIKEVTHQVLPGYEDVRLEDGTFLVPYLYPCAKKLLTAALAVEADGLRLKIYEAFRPQEATRFSYDTTERQMNDPVESGGTLSRLMTDNGRFNLGSFLARTISSHNRGIALDLTLEKIDGGGELEMQSVIHDLSWYSETYRNTLNAKLLEGYMTAVGMKGLSSEWWHFQDDETRAAIKLNSSLDKGVSPEGWTQDDGGWRYRDAAGRYARSTTMTVGGRTYTFDKDGYAAG